VENKTGDRENMKKARKYNRRLKDLFMTAALNVVHFDPTSHLAGYHRNFVKRGMEPTEAIKRVARALVRVIYRELTALLRADPAAPATASEKTAQSDVASGRGRGDKQHLSNTPLRSRKTTRARRRQRVKGTVRATARASSARGPRKRRVGLEKNA